MDKEIKAILYARFSPRRNADKSESIEIQMEFCRAYCAKAGIEIAGEFEDRVLSGGDENRPGLWAAVDALKKGYILVVYKLDRLARSVYLSVIIEIEVKKKNASILSISGEGTNGDSPEDAMIRQITQVIAEYMRKVTAARTGAAMLRHQATGRRMSHLIPYGKMVDPDDSKRLVDCPQEQAAIREIVRLSKSKLSLNEIERQLNLSVDFPPRKRVKVIEGLPIEVDGNWHHYMIGRILKRA